MPRKGDKPKRSGVSVPKSLAEAVAAVKPVSRRRSATAWYPESEVRTTFRMRRNEFEDLQRFAKAHGHSMQSMIERAINEMLQRRGIRPLEGLSDKTDLPI